MRWELRHGVYRAVIETQRDGRYVALLWREDTAAGRKAPSRSEPLRTQREARRWVYERIDSGTKPPRIFI